MLPDYVTALLMCVLYMLICSVPIETVFSAFSQSTFWLLLSSFALSLGLSRCGLMDRMAVYILRLFPNSFAWQALGLLTAGAVIGPFIPNLSAKAAILAPVGDRKPAWHTCGGGFDSFYVCGNGYGRH